jgi:F-type H+-transporting ATPase subunit a
MEKPTIDDLFPAPIFFKGTIFELNRIDLVRIIATIGIVILLLTLGRFTKLIPSRKQSMFEMLMGFAYKNLSLEVFGAKDVAKKYFPFIATIFFSVLALNITEVIPLLNTPSNALVAVPLILAIASWVAFVIAGIKQHGTFTFFKDSIFPPGIPKALYIIMTPIEFLSTFIMRPLTLTVRLMANMISGHLLLITFYSMTTFLMFKASIALKPFFLVSFAAVFVFTLFEIFVCCLQAYIFALLSAVYISLSKESH